MTLRLLIADDNAAIRKMVQLAFAGEEAVIEAVSNGEAALGALNDFRPDIVLADVSMPGYSGYEVCELIRHDPEFADVPVILLNGAFDPFDEEEAARVEVSGHLTKPFDPSEMIAMVEKLIAASVDRHVSVFFDKTAEEVHIETINTDEITSPPAESEVTAGITSPPAETVSTAGILSTSAESDDTAGITSAPAEFEAIGATCDFFEVPPRALGSYLGPGRILEIFNNEQVNGKIAANWRIPEELIDRIAEKVTERMFPHKKEVF